ncbi:MAG: 30S ribosome-binding factor RbfA [Gammaproteobacteria bacterium]|nr:30S ribosome-binding factor RbfA [Gammaproteobacteria bacterium]
MREFGRDLRVADMVREELACIIQRQMRDPRIGTVSVNDVRVSKDLSFADVYVSSLDTPDAVEQADLVAILNRAAGFFRSELAKRHSMRTTPKPRFHYDVAVERGPRLERLITDALAADRSAHEHG